MPSPQCPRVDALAPALPLAPLPTRPAATPIVLQHLCIPWPHSASPAWQPGDPRQAARSSMPLMHRPCPAARSTLSATPSTTSPRPVAACLASPSPRSPRGAVLAANTHCARPTAVADRLTDQPTDLLTPRPTDRVGQPRAPPPGLLALPLGILLARLGMLHIDVEGPLPFVVKGLLLRPEARRKR